MEGARLARPDDTKALASLRNQLVTEMAPQRGGAMLVEEAAPAEGPLPLPDPEGSDAAVIVGTWEDHVVGYGWVVVRRIGERRVGVVQEVLVQQEARGVGVGEAMMDLMTSWSAARGCRYMDGRALPGDRHAKGFFERHGLSARLLVMHREIPSSDAGT